MIFAAVAIGLLSSRIKVSNLYKWFVGSAILFIPMALSVYPLFLSASYSTIISYIMFSLCAMLIMFSITIINIFVMTILQQQTPNLLLGKVMAILTAVSTCAVPIGQILFGTLMDSFTTNVYVLLLIVAVVTIAIAITTKVLLKERKNEKDSIVLFQVAVLDVSILGERLSWLQMVALVLLLISVGYVQLSPQLREKKERGVSESA